MVTALQIAGLSVTTVLFAKLLQRYAAEQALLLTLLLGTAVTAAAVVSMAPILTDMDALLSEGGLSPAQTAGISKAIGICCVTQLASDVCKDAGESALSSGALLTGKITLILLTLPLFRPLLDTLREVLSCIPVFG